MKEQSSNYEAPSLEVLGSIADLTRQRTLRNIQDNANLLGSQG